MASKVAVGKSMKDEMIDVCMIGIAALGLAILYLIALLLGSYLFSMSVVYSVMATIKLSGTEHAGALPNLLLENLTVGFVGVIFLVSAFFLRKAGKRYSEELRQYTKSDK